MGPPRPPHEGGSSPRSSVSPLNEPSAKRPRLAALDHGVALPHAAVAETGEWAQIIGSLQPAIVALRVTAVRCFEEDPAATALGTGFVVSQERGLILTNRHVTGVGPVHATAIFDRHEEIDLEVVYRDPVHDFGFLRFDPSKLRLTRAAEIRLDPTGLVVGTEIRVVGNDAGEKLQILSGTIARVDRNVPEFNTIYNDENTFYAGAGAGTSGGSSGSPVINQQGCAIALNAAGTEGAASSFFLPLDRVLYTQDRLCAGQPVLRGTCLASFLFKPFDELKHVGLQHEHEQAVLSIYPKTTGMLIVDSTTCEQKILKAGDILLRLEGDICIAFPSLEAVLDAHAGDADASVRMLVRRSGEDLDLVVPIQDLHKLIPRSFVELGLDVLHSIGYHAARRVHMPIDSGMYLARAGYVFDSLGCGRAALITSVNQKPTPTLEAFVEAVKNIPDRRYFPVSYYELQEFRRDRSLKTGFAKMARAWSPLKVWHCEEGIGMIPDKWSAVELPLPETALPALSPGAAAGLVGGDPLVRKVQPSLVTVRFRTDRRFNTEGSYSGFSEGMGLLVDAERGLILTDRHSAPQSLGDVEVNLGGTTVDADVIFVHPLHNLAVVRCDTLALRKAKIPVKSANLATGATSNLRAGEVVYFVGHDSQGNTFSMKVTVAAVYLPSGKDEFPLWEVPRFRERNLEIVVLADTPEDARGGVLCDANGVVRAFFAAFDWQGQHREETTEAFGIPVCVFAPLVGTLRHQPDNVPLTVRSLDAEVSAVDVATLMRASTGHLPKAWLHTVGQHCGRQGQVARALRVHRVMPTGASEGQLKPGDVLLSIDGHAIACCLDIEEALRASEKKQKPVARRIAKRPAANRADSSIADAPASSCSMTGAEVPVLVRVFRDGKEVDVPVTPSSLLSADDSQLVVWAGIVLRSTPRCILERLGDTMAHYAAHSVFAQVSLGGSPADAREFNAHCFLVEVNGRPVHKLDDVIEALAPVHEVQHRERGGDRRWVRVRCVDLSGQEHVKAIQCDPLFFPTLELRRDECGHWQCLQH